ELIAVGTDHEGRPVHDRDLEPRLERDDLPHPGADVDRAGRRRRQPRQPRVRRHEPAERFRARRDYVQPAAEVLVQVGRRRLTAEERLQRRRDRLDRRERVVDLVAEYADQTLPGMPLLLTERAAEVGQDEEPVRQPALPELACPRLPTTGLVRERRLEGPRALAAVQRIAQPEVVGREAEEPLRGPGEETLARTVEEPEPA